MYGQPLKVTPSVKLLSVTIDSHLNMKLHVERDEYQNEYHKTKFNQFYPSNPSIQNFCKTVRRL